MIGIMIFWSVIVALTIAGVVAAHIYQDNELKKHQAAMAAWAAAHGLSYVPESDHIAQMFTGEPFSGGEYAKALDIISGPGPNGHRFWSYIYEYVVSNGKTSSTVRRWIVVLRMPRRLPWLQLSYETVGSRMLHAFGEQDIQLESDDFNKAYNVQAASPQFAFAVLHPRVIDWLLGPGRAIVPIRLAGQAMLWWQEGEPEYGRLASQVRAMAAFIDHIPSFVWHDYGRGVAGPQARPGVPASGPSTRSIGPVARP